ncbi:ComEA family DNA-binding protein [Flavilitoribacter nigricans]|uniref:Helix-hairpin-helix domain-containing protein n=1 Tax=Flavilitoribacter nigricans (strain ATCC 23147 / DSM 23189 / NBRC 102662 / NCIMB 1420 / SS-2) TaxID=1122177 RepID=A0A2D0MYT1_FLAN2|nr:helix-hairpin-helix domain-containing protein [Flavilitoribacter nigricans]PHN01424.1 hypothetical protein CRP01_37190 [Flavilitoribacter nigricans DSM 23189 = NBRC 102662]
MIRFTAAPFVWLTILVYSASLPAQTDTLPEIPESSRRLLEDYLQNSDEEGDFDFNTIYENLDRYLERPLNLNEAGEAELQDLRLLSDVQILNFLRYRELAGELVSIYELQAVPGLDLATIQAILPYVSIGGDTDDYQESLSDMLREGKNELYLRWSRFLEPQRGYRPLAEGESGSRYEGDPNQLYLRFKHSYSNRLSYGFTAEKDRGEAFFRASNKKGFDFYSAHFYLRDYNRTLKALALGDYTISLGQGLILFSGFGAGKSVLATSVKRGGRVVRPYTSVNEANFMRGAAVSLQFGERWSLTAFGSYRGRDGNLSPADTLDVDQPVLSFTSLDMDGLHRTPGEIEDRNALYQLSYGGSLKYQFGKGHLAFNALADHLDKPLIRREQPYNRYYFAGDHVANASLDYAYRWRNFHFFGETAIGNNGVMATVNSVLAGLDPKLDIALVHRHFPRDYVALNANPFAETTGARNEAGMYFGIILRPAGGWQISGYYDLWRHPWLRFNTDAPSGGYEYRFRIRHFKKRTYEAYLEVRDEVKGRNVSLFDTKTDWPVPSRVFQARLHLAYQLHKSLEWRSRIDIGFADNEINELQQGFAIYQDLLFRPIGFPLSFTTRFALFDTDGYAIRFYSYENNLLYSFSIPAYYNRGSRFYLNLRYKGIRKLTLEARIAQTYWWDQENIGSGLEQTDGPVRTQVAAQLKYQF